MKQIIKVMVKKNCVATIELPQAVTYDDTVLTALRVAMSLLTGYNPNMITFEW